MSRSFVSVFWLLLVPIVLAIGCGSPEGTQPAASNSEVEQYLQSLPDEDVGSIDDNVDVQ